MNKFWKSLKNDAVIKFEYYVLYFKAEFEKCELQTTKKLLVKKLQENSHRLVG